MKAIIDGIECEMSVAEFIDYQRAKEAEPLLSCAEVSFDEPLNVQLPKDNTEPKRHNCVGVKLRRPIRLKFADHNAHIYKSQKLLCETFPELNYCLLSAKHTCAEDYVRGQADVVRKSLSPRRLVEFTRWTLDGREIRVEFPTAVEVAR